ncbi:hypothetical protein MKW92_042561 [Papaver armeniacum]|nr:hypothetical protein MKW92_042561 [Papaver armeniacum]
MANNKYEYVKSFEVEDKLLPSTWIVLILDSPHFRQFSAEHEFKKPNDERAMKLMNSCAKVMFEEFPNIVFAYGKEFFPDKYLKSPPSFDACTICFPSADGVRDYLAWRQAEFCKNNQHNTWFWMLYTELTDIFCKGSCVFKDNMDFGFYTQVEETVKYNENGESIVKRFKSKVIIDHCDIVGDKFWNDHVNILKDE